MTLIEVVGGLGLLATLLVAMLLAKARYTRQAADAQRRLAAVAAADALLTSWHQNPIALPRAGSGIIPGDSGFSWRTQIVPNPEINALTAEVVRLEILDNNRLDNDQSVLTSIEFVVEPHPEYIQTVPDHPNAQRRDRRGRRSASGTDLSGKSPGAHGTGKR